MLVALAILALGVLVVVHEAGHYFVARWSRMRVERFSIGFGPAILKWRSRETQFQLAPIPFGGFVQITGMNPHEEFDEKDPLVYPNRPAALRFLVILAGPLMNYLLAVVVIFAFYLSMGIDHEKARGRVTKIEPGKPAAGMLQPGDRLLKVNGVDVWHTEAGPDFASEVQKSAGKPVLITIERGGKPVELTITPLHAPVSKEDDKPYKVGIALDPERKPVGLVTAAGLAAVYPVEKTQQILSNLKRVITGEVEGELSGPVGIVKVMHTSFEYGWQYALQLIAMLNVMLGLFNLLPIPGLDGGRLAFLGYELATRRRPNPKVEATVHMFGILILFLVLIVVTFKDIRNLFT
jgi:regulator of sigma E protease